MVPLFMCWPYTGDKVQGKVVLSNLQITTTMSMIKLSSKVVIVV